MAKRIVVAGYGAVGRALAPLLVGRGDAVTILQRHRPPAHPPGTAFVATDMEDADAATRACAGADTVVCTVGVPYRSHIYTRVWPVVMRNLLDASAAAGARLVFADNLYMYGPQTQPLAEDMPLTTHGAKPRVRAEITRLWQEAHAAGRVRAVAVRASDFYGPDVPTSVLSVQGIGRLLKGQSALAPYPPDQLHAFTYVPDFARALVALIDAPDDAYGQAWHVPNAPTKTLRELMTLAAKQIGVAPRITVLPGFLSPVIGLFVPEVRELAEMRFQWDRPYLVDTSKFAKRFWDDATPFEQGFGATIAFERRKSAA